MNIFTYGTLMCAEIMHNVTGEHNPGEDARLNGYKRRKIKGEVYPGITEQEGAHVDGVLYFNISSQGLDRLDLFEGDRYQRVKIKVLTANKIVFEAWAYVLKPQFEILLMDIDWSLQEFLISGRVHFEKWYKGFQMVKGDIEKKEKFNA